MALVIAKTKVAPNKGLSVQQLEPCIAVIVPKLLDYCQKVLEIPSICTEPSVYMDSKLDTSISYV